MGLAVGEASSLGERWLDHRRRVTTAMARMQARGSTRPTRTMSRWRMAGAVLQ